MDGTLTPAQTEPQTDDTHDIDVAAWTQMIEEVFARFEFALERHLAKLEALSEEGTVRA